MIGWLTTQALEEIAEDGCGGFQCFQIVKHCDFQQVGLPRTQQRRPQSLGILRDKVSGKSSDI